MVLTALTFGLAACGNATESFQAVPSDSTQSNPGDPGEGGSTTTPEQRGMTVERLREPIIVPFEAGSSTGQTELVDGSNSDGRGITVRMELDGPGPTRPIIADLTGDGINDALVLVFRSYPVANLPILMVVDDGEVVAFTEVNFDGRFPDGPVRPAVLGMSLEDQVIGVAVTANATFETAPTEIQQFVFVNGTFLRI